MNKRKPGAIDSPPHREPRGKKHTTEVETTTEVVEEDEVDEDEESSKEPEGEEVQTKQHMEKLLQKNENTTLPRCQPM